MKKLKKYVLVSSLCLVLLGSFVERHKIAPKYFPSHHTCKKVNAAGVLVDAPCDCNNIDLGNLPCVACCVFGVGCGNQ